METKSHTYFQISFNFIHNHTSFTYTAKTQNINRYFWSSFECEYLGTFETRQNELTSDFPAQYMSFLKVILVFAVQAKYPKIQGI